MEVCIVCIGHTTGPNAASTSSLLERKMVASVNGVCTRVIHGAYIVCGSQTVICYLPHDTGELASPHSQPDTSVAYSIYLLRRDGRLSCP